MADSPKCQECSAKGVDAQTYKVAGKPHYRCQKCQNIYHAASFAPEEFLWKDEPAKWETFMKAKEKVKVKEKI